MYSGEDYKLITYNVNFGQNKNIDNKTVRNFKLQKCVASKMCIIDYKTFQAALLYAANSCGDTACDTLEFAFFCRLCRTIKSTQVVSV